MLKIFPSCCLIFLFIAATYLKAEEQNYELVQNFEVMNLDNLQGRILFNSKIEGRDRIFLLDLNKKSLVTIISGPGNNSAPSWAPDGERFLFVSDRDGNKEIYLNDLKADKLSRITRAGGVNDYPSFAPDNRRILYQRENKPKEVNIFTINSDGENRLQVTSFTGHQLFPKWSPDGRYILYTTDRYWPGWDVCIWDLAKQIESCPVAGRSSYYRGSWSHSGNFIAYSKGLSHEVDIETFELRTRNANTVTNLGGKEYDATWSPEDRFLLFVAENGGEKELFNLYITDVGSGKVKQIVQSPYPIRFPSWTAGNVEKQPAKQLEQK